LTDNAGFTIPPKLYDFLKWIALAVLPAAAALVITIGTLLHWEDATVTAGVITAVDTFLGLTLGKSSSNYKQNDPQAVGDIVFTTDEDGSARIGKIVVNQENPVFNDGGKVYLTVKREHLLDE
jgi:hypothetical protein